MEFLGDGDLFKYYKTGFLSSRKCSAEVVLKSYEWAKRQRKERSCVVCGNHSQIEKDVFDILLKGEQPLLLVLPRGLKKLWDKHLLHHVEKGRLLIISPFPIEITRITRETALIKNKTIIKLSDQVTIGYKSKDGQLDKILNKHEFDYV